MLTVLMATYNGSRTIGACLDAYCRLDPPSGGWKLVIVDNASTDSTGEIVRSFASRLPVHYCHEPVQGKNAALNTGLREASGDLVVFTDDDAVPHAGWLTSMREAADAQPAYTMFGGKILPRWESSPESWILECVPLGVAYAVTPPTFREGEIGASSLFGPNMAIRASVFDSGCRFDPSIGPCGDGSYTMGSETELSLRLERSGLKAWHVESAVVEHIVQDFKVTPKWILRRAALFGREVYRLHDEKRFINSTKLCGVPVCLIRRALLEAAKLAHARLFLDSRKRFGFRWKLNLTLGEIIESRELWHRARMAS
jgi:cellulose synthase/poly-beta-1,6-N-acetylglucosamine synthase-like glycosyltransferase